MYHSDMDLKTFIEKIGDAPAAVLFDTTVHAVYSWRTGRRYPTAAKSLEIERKTRRHKIGHVKTIREIFENELPTLSKATASPHPK